MSDKKKSKEFHSLLNLIFLSFLTLSFPVQTHSSQCKKNPIIFNFGDSNSDTGGLVSGLGFVVNPPNGRSFFHRSTGRLSDGRLVIDFLCESLNSTYLSPYLDSLGSNFRSGANFAVVGSSTLPKMVPFALDIQIMQFLHFKARSLELSNYKGSKVFIDEDGFKNALYMVDIGQNDLAEAFAKNLSYDLVVRRIPEILVEIKIAVKTLYGEGGKNFWIHNSGPLGCLPQELASLDRQKLKAYDSCGCVKSYNDAVKVFNEGLHTVREELRSELKTITIVYVDMYSIKYDLIANFKNYGFNNPLMACCGHGGPPYNYNPNYTCGQPGCSVCEENGSKYISWDGTHYSEAANSIIASKVLSTRYSTPKLKFDYFCSA